MLTESNSPMPQGSNFVIEIKDVSVRYRMPQERIPSLKEFMIRSLKSRIKIHEFWALHHVDLQVKPGEVLGIVGSNGAGKSTLLKVISRVLRPTTGVVRIHGRLAPLLELGAGFDYELTGRENIILNGAILGFTRREIEKRTDRIVEFAGLKDFVDAPLRTYSTGMVARLGFSVATDVRPNILIVDEILSVGDAEFQTRSFERILGFQAENTTILLVSHSLGRVEEMCSRAIWLDHGEVRAAGSASMVINRYLNLMRDEEEQRMELARAKELETRQVGGIDEAGDDAHRWGTRKMEITGVKIYNGARIEQSVFRTKEPLLLKLSYRASEPIKSPVFGIAFHRQDGTHISGPNSGLDDVDFGTLSGEGTILFQIPSVPMLDGLYYISVAVVNEKDTEIFDYHDRQYQIRIFNGGTSFKEKFGLITVNGSWSHLPKP